MNSEMEAINLMDLPSDILKSIFKKSRELSKMEYELNKNNHNEKFKSVMEDLIHRKILCRFDFISDYGYNFDYDKPRNKYLEKGDNYMSSDWFKEENRLIRNGIRFLGYKKEIFNYEIIEEFSLLFKCWNMVLINAPYMKKRIDYWNKTAINLMDMPPDILKYIFKLSREASKEEYELNKENHFKYYKNIVKDINVNYANGIAIVGKSIGLDFGGFVMDGGYEGQIKYSHIYWKYSCCGDQKKYSTFIYHKKYIENGGRQYEPRIKYLKENHIEVFKKNLLNEICLTDYKDTFEEVMDELLDKKYSAKHMRYFGGTLRGLLIHMCASTDGEESSSEEESSESD